VNTEEKLAFIIGVTYEEWSIYTINCLLHLLINSLQQKKQQQKLHSELTELEKEDNYEREIPKSNCLRCYQV